MKQRTVTEYRLLVQRTGNAVKDTRSRSLKAVERRVGILMSPEPWRFYGDRETRQKGPDDYFCCAGTYHDQCGCGGATMREETEARRKDLPAIEWIRLQKRQVVITSWEPCDVPIPNPAIPCDYCAGNHETPECPLEAQDVAPPRVEESQKR